MNAPFAPTQARAPLSEADISRLVASGNADDRAVAAHKVCRAMERRTLSAAERDAAQDIIRLLAGDAAELVRRALAVTLRTSDLLPHDVAVKLAQDALSVAVPLISHSPLFSDDDLTAMIRSGGPVRQVAVAKREAQSLAEEAKQKTADYVARRTALSEQKIKQAETEAVNAVRAAAVDLAIAAAEKVLAKKTDDGVQQQLFKASVAEVKSRLN